LASRTESAFRPSGVGSVLPLVLALIPGVERGFTQM
jgi:hypothetical protein